MKQVLITLRLCVEDAEPVPTSEQITDALTDLLADKNGDWYLLGYDTSLAEIQDKTSS